MTNNCQIMTPERWQRIETLYHSALEHEPAQRFSFLDQACGSDRELRREVEPLLAQHASRDGPLDRPALDTGAEPTQTQLAIGSQLGPYKISGSLGAGGMGQVYKARDTRLGREVAIKILSERFSDRFEREARAVAALNHQHICTLYDVGPDYLVMELVEGETLAERLKKGALSMEQTLQFGIQIAEALVAAHAKGITHRDLKPGNIMLAKSGVKVLDFGLAKSHCDETVTATQAVMGTPAYMAPEQREGKDCDARTDIFALGLVLAEMATGQRTAPAAEPQLDSLPAKFAHVIDRCLAQDPDDLWQTARDIKSELEWAGKPTATSPPAEHPRRDFASLARARGDRQSRPRHSGVCPLPRARTRQARPIHHHPAARENLVRLCHQPRSRRALAGRPARGIRRHRRGRQKPTMASSTRLRPCATVIRH